MLPVAVEVAPPNAPREQVTALLGACSRAVANAECVLASEAPEGGTQAVAIVTWQSDGRATVEVGLRREGKPEWRSRNVTFGEADEPIERWRALGFVVGTLARGETPGEPAAGQEAEPAPKPAQPAPKPAEPAHVAAPAPTPVVLPTHPARAALELGAVMGPALDGLRTGGVLRTRWPLYDPLRSLISIRYVERPSDDNGVRAQWVTLAAGVGGVLGSAHSELGASLDARVEYIRASADYLGRTGSDSRWLPGGALTLWGAWMPMPSLGLYLAAEGAWMATYTPVRFKGQPVGEDRKQRAALDAGIRVRLW